MYQVCLPKVASADHTQPPTRHSAHISQVRTIYIIGLELSSDKKKTISEMMIESSPVHALVSIRIELFAFQTRFGKLCKSQPMDFCARVCVSSFYPDLSYQTFPQKSKSLLKLIIDFTGMLDSAREFPSLHATQTLSTSLESFTGFNNVQ